MKESLKIYRSKTAEELKAESKKESLNLSKNWISISLGKEKKTHLNSVTRRRIAQLKTLINQKKFLEKI